MGFISDIVDGFVKSNPIGQAVNLFSSGITSAINRHSQKETNKRNAEQNELNRQFSAEEAAKNRQFQVDQNVLQNEYNAQQANAAFERSSNFQREMWNKENEYNSPAAQVKRLTDAGFNPNLFGGDNTAGSAGSASSPAASGSAPSGSAASAPSSIPMQPYSVTNPLLESAQIKLANSQAKLNESNTDESKERAETLRALRQGQVDLQNVQIHLGLSAERLNDAEIRHLYKDCQKIDKEMAVAEQSVRNMQVQYDNMLKEGVLTDKNIDAFDKQLQVNIAKALAETAQAYGMVNVSKKQCELLAEQISHTQIANGIIAIDFNKAFAGAPSETGLIISANQSEQSYYDWQTGDWLRKLWDDDSKSFGKKLWQTGTQYGNWITHSIAVGMNGSFNMRETSNVTKLAKP